MSDADAAPTKQCNVDDGNNDELGLGNSGLPNDNNTLIQEDTIPYDAIASHETQEDAPSNELITEKKVDDEKENDDGNADDAQGKPIIEKEVDDEKENDDRNADDAQGKPIIDKEVDNDKENECPSPPWADNAKTTLGESQALVLDAVDAETKAMCSLCQREFTLSEMVGKTTSFGKGVCSVCNTRRSILSRTFEGGLKNLTELKDLDEQAQVDFWRSDLSKGGKHALIERLAKCISQNKVRRNTSKTKGEFRPLKYWAQEGYDADRIEQMTPDEDKKFSDMHGWLYKVNVESSTNEEVEEEIIQQLRKRMSNAKGRMLVDMDDELPCDRKPAKPKMLMDKNREPKKKGKRSRSNESNRSSTSTSSSSSNSDGSANDDSESEELAIKTPSKRSKKEQASSTKKTAQPTSTKKDRMKQKEAEKKAKQKEADSKQKEKKKMKDQAAKEKEAIKAQKKKDSKAKAQEKREENLANKRRKVAHHLASKTKTALSGTYSLLTELHDRVIKEGHAIGESDAQILAGVKANAEKMITHAASIIAGECSQCDHTNDEVRDACKQMEKETKKLKLLIGH